jgi:hypothetical protein
MPIGEPITDPHLPNRQAANEKIEKETLLMVDYFRFARHPPAIPGSIAAMITNEITLRLSDFAV